ncbi:protein phosphatase 2C domain-containing protein [Streptomyces sp. NPDC006996]|uniref:protein phosphatase 2C domain-containing protein n=1 Tax=Streptomyces sp. NPDC006996 TaxID=3156908 RepID=UPI0033D6C1C9
MSQQGGTPTGPEDDWWGQLYDDAADDTGPAPAPDSLDDRFASASDALDTGRPSPTPATRLPAPRPSAAAPTRAPWEPPPAAPAGPVTFPPPPRRPSTTRPHEDADRGAPGNAGRDIPEDGGRGTSGNGPGGPGIGGRSAPEGRGVTGDAGDRGSVRDVGRGAPDGTPAGLPPMTFGSWTPFPASVPEEQRAATGGAAPVSADVPPPADPRIEPRPTPPSRGYVGSRPPTYDAEPTALPEADPDGLDGLDGLVPDTVLDGARYGACTLRAASVRGDSARYRGEPRRDALLTARFGTGERALLLVALATGTRTAPGAHLAAAEACRWIGGAVGRSHARLVDDIRAARRGDLKSGLHRLTDRTLGRLRAGAAEQGLEPDAYTAGLRCLLVPADPECRTRVFFGVGPGGLFRLRDGEWQDIEPEVAQVRGEPVLSFGSPPAETPAGDRLTMDLGIPAPPSPYEPAPEPPREPFRFRTSVARPGDTLLLCGTGLADPLRGERELRAHLAERWSRPGPPGLAAFLADTQVRVKGYADDRTAVAVWEA